MISGNAAEGKELAFPRLGRSFEAGQTTIKIDLQFFNVFNNDAHDSWQTLIVAPGDAFYPRAYVLPRRIGLRLGVHF